MAITTITVFLSSCEKGEETITESQKQFSDAENQRIMDALCNSNSDCEENIEIADGGVTVGGCMHFDKANVLEYLNNPSENGQLGDRQATYNITGFSHQHLVGDAKVYVKPELVSIGFNENLFDDAVAEINGIIGCEVEYKWHTNVNTADIIVASDEDLTFWASAPVDYSGLDAGALGKARGPNSGTRNIGKYTAINYDVALTTTTASKEATLKHELLHNIGVAHTNDYAMATRTHIFGTAYNDANSLMNSPRTVETLSVKDIEALIFLWPKDLEQPTYTAHSFNKGKVYINFNNPGGNAKRYQRIRLKSAGYPDFIVEGSWDKGSNIYRVAVRYADVPGPTTGHRQLRICGESYYGDVSSQCSNLFGINVPAAGTTPGPVIPWNNPLTVPSIVEKSGNGGG